MGETKPFQLIFVAVCVVLTIAGVFIFSFAGPKQKPGQNYGPKAVVWGTEDEEKFNDLITLAERKGANIHATYVQKDEATFGQDLLEALAIGKGPDVILIPVEDMLTYQDKVYSIPFDALSESDFRATFIEEGELYRTDKGYSALPFSVDPLVMYWNRDFFTNHNMTLPPSKWSSVVSLVPEMRDVSEDLTVFEAVISLGDYRNVNNAKAILATLMLQSGTDITSLGYQPSEKKLFLTSHLTQSASGSVLTPAVAALNFYTQFADPLTKQYTWNRSLPTSLDMFASDDLAMYVGFGSELDLIRSKNPNLNFDMALLPQSDASPTPVTYGKMKGLAILSSSKNKTGAFYSITALTDPIFAKMYTDATKLAPVRRDLLATPPGDAHSSILYRSAIYSRGFLDPQPAKTDTIFRTMVESVLSGRSSSGEALGIGENQFRLLVGEFNAKQIRDEK
jgi:ABC-type glycerol-3-phosphate transport system substrate-binding protein